MNTLLETQEERLKRRDAESSKHIRVPYVINEEVVEEEEEEEGGDGGDEEAQKDSEDVKATKQRKRNDKTKDLVAKRVHTSGLVNRRWTVLPRDYTFPNVSTMVQLIDSWLLSDGQQMIPPFVQLQASHLTKAKQKVH